MGHQRFGWFFPVIREEIWPTLPEDPGPLRQVTREEIDCAIRAQYARHHFAEMVSFRRSYLLRWWAWGFAIVAPVLVLLAQGTEWAKAASVLPVLSTAFLGLEAFEPFTAKSGWHHTYKLRLERLLLDLPNADPQDIAERWLTLKGEMARTYPHWKLSRDKAGNGSPSGKQMESKEHSTKPAD